HHELSHIPPGERRHQLPPARALHIPQTYRGREYNGSAGDAVIDGGPSPGTLGGVDRGFGSSAGSPELRLLALRRREAARRNCPLAGDLTLLYSPRRTVFRY